MAEIVKFTRGNARIKQLAGRPDLADGVARIRTQIADADREYAAGLAEVRRAAELTQVELADRLGVTQAAVSRIEQPHDLLLSTLSTYLQAVGGRARLVVTFEEGTDIELDLSGFPLTPPAANMTQKPAGNGSRNSAPKQPASRNSGTGGRRSSGAAITGPFIT